MITSDAITRLSTKLQTSELNIRREYFQHLFLSYLYQLPESETLLFKGGTALRLVYNSPRFSEDLDFSTKKTNSEYIEKLLMQGLAQMEKENINTNLKEAKSTTGGYLAIVTFSGFDQAIDIMMQVSFRPSLSHGQSVVIHNQYIPFYSMMTYQQNKLTAEKIQALLTRGKPRDFYDLYFMMRSQMLSESDKKEINNIIKIVQKSTINFDRELKIFLPKSHWMIIKDFKENLTSELIRNSY